MQRDGFTVKSFPSLEAYHSDSTASLDVLIATEEIIGPVRNGGIASTYYHLARGLVAEGHRVTVLYLKGRKVENATPEYWVNHYAKLGIDFVCLPELDEPFTGASAQWQQRWLSFYRWLRTNDRFDVVHSSEWRGGAFYALQAKRLGLAFADTLFIIKTSSPYIWNRHYQMRPIDSVDLLVASFAEQKCVEWADVVVGGSAHLLSFMDHIGYRLPEGRCYVQPNIVDFSEIRVSDQRPVRAVGDTVKTGELVFFGRLEPRKGLDLFVLAIDALVAQGVQISCITFLGKEGERISSHDGQKPCDFIRAHAAAWPFPIDIVTDLNQPEALSLMCSRDMIAVMPSLIENSTMTVYEALVHKIPFIATSVGGTAELVDPADHATALVPPEIDALSGRIGAALSTGQKLAAPAFDNRRNLEIWYGFHRYLSEHQAKTFLPEVPEPDAGETLSYLGYLHRPSDLSDALRDAAYIMHGFAEILIYVPFVPTQDQYRDLAELHDDRVVLVEAIGVSVGDCFNSARSAAKGNILVFDATGATRFNAKFAETVRQALTVRPDDLVTGTALFDANARNAPDTLFVPLGGDPATQASTGAAYGLELLAGRKSTFDAMGEFQRYRVPKGTLHEYVTRTVQSNRELFVLPDALLVYGGDGETITAQDGVTAYLTQKPLIDASPLPVKKMLLQKTGAARPATNKGRVILGQAYREPGGTAWLSNMDKVARPEDELPNPYHIVLGFEREAARLQFAALHEGVLVITANGREIRRDQHFGAHGEFTRSTVEIMPLLEQSDRLRLRIELTSGGKRRFASLLAQRIEEGVFFLSARGSIFWGADFREVLASLGGRGGQSLLPPLHRVRARRPSLAQKIRRQLRKGNS